MDRWTGIDQTRLDRIRFDRLDRSMNGQNDVQTDRVNHGGPLNAPTHVMNHKRYNSGQNSTRRTGRLETSLFSHDECIGMLDPIWPRFFNIIFGIIFASAMFYFEGVPRESRESREPGMGHHVGKQQVVQT